MTNILLSLLIILVLAIFIIGLVVLLKKPSAASDETILSELKKHEQFMTVMAEKMRGIETMMPAINNTVIKTGSDADKLVAATEALRNELNSARREITAMDAHAKARREAEERSAESIRRLESIIAGTQTKGSAGENIIEIVFSKLPVEWQVRNLTVNNKVCEFGLRLPNRLILPIDSKWPATNLLEMFVATDNPAERQRIKAQIEIAVMSKAREVQKYLDPHQTTSFGVAVIPDAVYDLCYSVQPQAFTMKVVLVSYSMFVPYLLLVVQTILASGQSIDMNKLVAHLQAIDAGVNEIQNEIEGRFTRGFTMMDNSRMEIRAQIGKIRNSTASLQVDAAGSMDAPLPIEPL